MPTEAEKKLWSLLRDRRLGGLKFRRQVPIGDFIADFICLEHMLIVEVDGSQHAGSDGDQERDERLRQQGYRVLRLWNIDVLREPESVKATVAATCGLPI